ncbi:MAG: hypothetical protein HW407_1321 [Bacteroidetes bacterium]|nr:hypothetical protein [Bacteroidota bacterium]
MTENAKAEQKPAGKHSEHMGQTRVVVFTLLLAILSGIALGTLLAILPSMDQQPDSPGSTGNQGLLLATTTGVMFLAGIIGGCLYNLRGLIKHSVDDDYQNRYGLSYYLRPASGGISGVIVFFLLLGGAMTLNVGNSNANASWTTLLGRMPYLAFSLLAGYGSNEFMAKLKDLAESLFALKKKD